MNCIFKIKPKPHIMGTFFWKLFQAAKWSAKHYRMFIVFFIVFFVSYLLISIWYHNKQCRQGITDRLRIGSIYEHECNFCADTIANNTVVNNGKVAFLNNGNGKITASGVTIVEPNPSIPSLIFPKKFVQNFEKAFSKNRDIDAYYKISPTSSGFTKAKLLMDGLKNQLGSENRIIWSLPLDWQEEKKESYIIVDSNSIEIVSPKLDKTDKLIIQ